MKPYALALIAVLAAGCSGQSGTASAPSAKTSPSPSVNAAVLGECQQIAPLLGEVSEAFDAGSSGQTSPAQAYVKVQQVREKIDALADTFSSREIAVNAHGIADRIGVTLVSLRRGDDDPEVAIATVGTATDDFLAACHRVAGG